MDILYPYSVISKQFTSISSNKTTSSTTKKSSIKARLIELYTEYLLNHIFADAWKKQDLDPLPVTVRQPKVDQVKQVASFLRRAKRPLIILGSQSVLKPYGPEFVADSIKRLGIPVFLDGAARGILGANYEYEFRHAREEAVKKADCVLILGAKCHGCIFDRKVISINRSSKLSAGIFRDPIMTVESDVAKFVIDLTSTLKPTIAIDREWLSTLKKFDE